MAYNDDGLSIIEGFVSCSETKFDLSKSENLEKFIKSYPPMDIYKDYHAKLAEKNDNDGNLNSLLFMNLLLQDTQNYIAANQTEIKRTHQFRLGAIGKISIRLIEITDENIALLKNGFGTSVISNLRLMLELYAISKYLMGCDDLESDKFQDFGIVQECRIQGTDPKSKLKAKNYPDDFYTSKSEYAWSSDKSIKNVKDFIVRLKMDNIKDWYKYYCKYVHASPYSCGKIHQLNQKSWSKDNAYMPIDMKNLIQQNKYYTVLFIELISDNFILDETIKKFFKTISQVIYNFER